MQRWKCIENRAMTAFPECNFILLFIAFGALAESALAYWDAMANRELFRFILFNLWHGLSIIRPPVKNDSYGDARMQKKCMEDYWII